MKSNNLITAFVIYCHSESKLYPRAFHHLPDFVASEFVIRWEVFNCVVYVGAAHLHLCECSSVVLDL